MTQVDKIIVNQVTISSSVPTAICSGTRPKVGVQVKSLTANTGLIYIGNSDVSSTKCYPLSPGESIFLPVGVTDSLYALAAVNNEKVHYVIL